MAGHIHSAVERKTLSVEEAAAALGIGRGLAYALARRGELPAIRLGHRLVVPRVALDEFLASGRRRS